MHVFIYNVEIHFNNFKLKTLLNAIHKKISYEIKIK